MNAKRSGEEKDQVQAGKGQMEEGQSVKVNVEKFPSDLDNLSEEDKKKWFTVEEFAGRKILKVKPEMFTPPKVEGDPVFLFEETEYQKQEREPSALVFEKDF